METFSDDDWRELTPHDKRALRQVAERAPGFTPLYKFPSVGEKMIQSLLGKELVEEGRSYPRNEIGYRLTEKGYLAYERLIGRRSGQDGPT